MRLFYILSLTFFISVTGFAQHHYPLGDISCPPPKPAGPALYSDEPVVTSRSGNHYKIPFDTVQYNSTIGTGGFDIVICIDGVINNTQIELADNYVDSFVRKLQTVPHYAARFKYINIYRIAKLSAEEGSAYGFTNKPVVNNRYGSTYNAYNLPRLLLPLKVDTLFADVKEFVPNANLVLMLAFDKKYGGSGWNLYDGRQVGSFSIDEEYGAGSYHLSDEIMMHEMQHMMPFGGRSYLADEYQDDPACSIYDTLPVSYKNSPNYTSDTVNNRKWQRWIDAGTPGVGFYDSAGVCPGNYRSTRLCIMRQIFNIPTPGINLGMPPFCPVCRENSAAYFDSVINPVYFTGAGPLTYTGTYTFRVQVDTPLLNTYRNQWLLDDSIVATGPASFEVNFGTIGITTDHTLKFVCTDMDPIIKDTTLWRPWTTTWTLHTKDTAVGINGLTIGKEYAFDIYPNPATNQLRITVSGFQPERTALYNISGRKLKEVKYSPQVDISTLATGMYFIELYGQGILTRRQFVKE